MGFERIAFRAASWRCSFRVQCAWFRRRPRGLDWWSHTEHEELRVLVERGDVEEVLHRSWIRADREFLPTAKQASQPAAISGNCMAKARGVAAWNGHALP